MIANNRLPEKPTLQKYKSFGILPTPMRVILCAAPYLDDSYYVKEQGWPEPVELRFLPLDTISRLINETNLQGGSVLDFTQAKGKQHDFQLALAQAYDQVNRDLEILELRSKGIQMPEP